MIVVSRVPGEWISSRRRPLRALALLLAASPALFGCSISMPLSGFIDNDTTGSIKPRTEAANPFAPEDWRIAEGALKAAMRDDSEHADWKDETTGRRGRFRVVAAPFKRNSETCQAFLARVEEKNAARELQGLACRTGSEAIALEDVSPWVGL